MVHKCSMLRRRCRALRAHVRARGPGALPDCVAGTAEFAIGSDVGCRVFGACRGSKPRAVARSVGLMPVGCFAGQVSRLGARGALEPEHWSRCVLGSEAWVKTRGDGEGIWACRRRRRLGTLAMLGMWRRAGGSWLARTLCHIHKKVTRARVMQGLADTGLLSMSGIFGREVGKLVWPVRGWSRAVEAACSRVRTVR